jgi:hypothetical protein
VTYWAWLSIEGIKESNITQGCHSDPPEYCPEKMVSRAQLAIFLLRGLFGPDYVPPAADGVFADVDRSSYAAPWIEDFYHQGFTFGCSTDPPRFCPASKLSRVQMAVFLVRAKHGADYMPPPAIGIFSDVPLDGLFDRYIEQLYRDEITSGCATAPLRFCPQNHVSRAKMAVLLDRLFGLNPEP